MKIVSLLGLAATVLTVLPVSAVADVTITPANLGDLSTMPGSAGDFTLFGKSSQFPTINSYGGLEEQPTVLNDFSVAAGSNAGNLYGGNGYYSVINAPTGSGDTDVTSGIIFNNGSSAPDLVSFTLGAVDSTFNFSDFNVYVMYGNAHDGYEINTSIDAELLSPSSAVLASSSPTITDSNVNFSDATYEEFTVTGASAGDVLQLGAGGWGYLGGVSFESVPEPSTYAMMVLGLGAIGFCLHRRAASLN